jgi:hypothetical protein
VRVLYADMSPGIAWDGRDPEALEAATATQVTSRTVVSFVAAGVTALANNPRPLAFLVGGTTPSHAPATATITGTDEDDAALVEAVTLPTTSAGARRAGAVCSRGAFKTVTQVAYSAGGGIGATVAIGLGLIPGVADLRLIPIEMWLEAFGDRSRPGYLDPLAIDQIAITGSSFVDEGVGEPHGNYPTPFALPPPTGVARIARDRCFAEAGKLRPGSIGEVIDPMALLKDATRERDLLKKAHTGTGTAPPDPAANTGGAVYPSPSCPSNKPKFVGKWKFGIF